MPPADPPHPRYHPAPFRPGERILEAGFRTVAARGSASASGTPLANGVHPVYGPDMPMTPRERSLSNTAASHASWAHTVDRSARTASARANGPGSLTHWLAKLDPERFADATDDQRLAAAVSMRKAHFATLAAKSVKSRNAKRAGGHPSATTRPNPSAASDN